jgi:hypothetical protein
MALTSPGVEVSIIDQSQFGSAGQGTVPLIILATQSNKDNVSGTGFATGTIPANANKPYLLTSQRELVEQFGQPKFKTVNGTAIHGSEVNEYGLMAAYSYLGLANRAYVLRADIDLLQLEPTDIEPAGAPTNGTYWLDLANTSWGIFEASAIGTSSWVTKTPLVITDSADTVSSAGVVPATSIGANGDYAVVATSTVSSYQVYKKISGAWEICTTANSAISTVFVSAHYNIPTATAAGDVWLKTTSPNNGLSLAVKKYVSANIPDNSPWVVVATPVYVNDSAATTGFASALSAGKVYAKADTGSANVELRYYDGSNWNALNEQSGASAPVGATIDGTLWYNTSLAVDLYVKANSQWEPIGSDITIDSNAPSSPANGDFWIDSSDVENYPGIYEYDGSSWVSRNVTDQTTPNGVVFADLTVTASDTTNGTGGATAVDENAPDPLLYPNGILLWNGIVSTGNVKQYSDVLDASGVATGDKAWFTFSGNKEDGSPYMLRKAQRRAVVKSLQSAVASNETIREEMTFFTLIAAPGYPELIDEMLSLNTDRKETAFVIVDTPMRLAPQGQTLIDWMSGNNASSTGEDGLIVSGGSAYQAACYYPSALATDLSGNDVVVPASHVVLRTYAYNDQVAYPWFAPAGLTRGVVTNASNVGYINGEGEFIPVALTTGQRDTLYGDGSRVGLNPIARFPGQGVYVFGQKTLQTGSSALDRVNVARLLAYLRERFDPLARPFIFEPNDKITRANVKQVFDSFLGELLAKRAIYDFIVVCDETNNTPARIDRNELYVDVAIEPVKAAEFIYIPVRVVNTGELS